MWPKCLGVGHLFSLVPVVFPVFMDPGPFGDHLGHKLHDLKGLLALFSLVGKNLFCFDSLNHATPQIGSLLRKFFFFVVVFQLSPHCPQAAHKPHTVTPHDFQKILFNLGGVGAPRGY